MKAAELIVLCLENEGVEYLFGVPGEENMDLLDALLGISEIGHALRLPRPRSVSAARNRSIPSQPEPP